MKRVLKRVLKWFGYGLGGVAALALVAVAGAFGVSEMMIRRSADAPLTQISVPRDDAAVARGHRLATVAGCMDCHGERLEGRLFHDEPMVVRAFAPNLTLAAAKQSDAELERAIRRGVGSDHRSLWVMPSSAFSRLTDAETADLIAYLRSLKPEGKPQPRFQVGPIGRIGVLIGQFSSEPDLLKAADMRQPLPALGSQHAEGRALARNCVECHGAQLRGDPGLKTPDLTMAASYDSEDFEKLLRTGVAAGNRRLGLMSEISPKRFNALSSQEIAALHGYLKARAAQEITDASETLPKS